MRGKSAVSQDDLGLNFYIGMRIDTIVSSRGSVRKMPTPQAFSLVDYHSILFLEILQSSIVLHIHRL